MRPELEEIKYIEDYILNKLSTEQKGEFEKRMVADVEFAQKVKLQKVLLKRVNRLSLKHTVAQAHRKHTQRNTFMFKRNKNFFKSFISLILVLVVAYLIYLSDIESEGQSSEQDSLKKLPINEEVLKQKIKSLQATHFRMPVENSNSLKYKIRRKDSKNDYEVVKGIEIYNSSPPVPSITDTIYSIGHGYAMAFAKNNLSVIYKHNNEIIKTTFYNCDTILCPIGGFVNKGQVLATFGKNDSSLFITMLKENIAAPNTDLIEYVDPEEVLPF